MPGLIMEVKIEGLEELGKKLDGNYLLAQPAKEFFGKAALEVKREAIKLTPVDTGRLRASFTHTIDASPVPLWAKVGSNVKYALFVEEDTRSHWPPPSALEGWAQRHGIPTFLVGRAIAQRGTKGSHMLKKGFEQSKDKIKSLMSALEAAIKERWG